MLINKVIPINSLEASVRVLITDSIAQAVNKLNKEGYNITLNGSKTIQGLSGYSVVDDKYKFYTIIKVEESLKITLKVMVHEIYHVNQDILENRGVKYKKGDANEAYAYNIDYLFGALYDLIIKAHNKKFNKQQ